MVVVLFSSKHSGLASLKIDASMECCDGEAEAESGASNLSIVLMAVLSLVFCFQCEASTNETKLYNVYQSFVSSFSSLGPWGLRKFCS
jgi:hypothetical protein